MAVHTTRMLLLGAVAMFEPVNGYQIRRELVSWRVDEWANLGPGSIYGGLSTLVKLGQVVRHDVDDEGRTVAVYEITQSGRGELARLLGEGLETVTLFNAVGFHAAFGMLPLLDRDVATRHLEVRLHEVDRALEAWDPGSGHEAPPHAVHGVRLWLATLREERVWLADTVGRLRSGEFDLAGEPWRWVPPADDPGRQMAVDGERYRALLGREPS
ncbi:DNA-binding PadR family transcriptional regulator [Nocardioides cavernae]|uniref:DNA-binding PadR family transcriptional regulator n=1 Tax=Nocardioides cavernae TaxID=1921566 RepID=A0A7Y9H325_9ACTN|nr:PadR family transcriptional regulator [Nocardioides cavernae]NYE36294.1 DNA-binding PadR family transcriptional regulator [Nocardioides cavernae]